MRIRTANPNELKLHPLARLIPDMRPSEWEDFYADIALRGIKVPLEVLADGMVVDGRHRLRAAIELGMKEVPIIDAPLNGESPEAYMLKAAVLRRHLTDDQRAALAALWKEENKKKTGPKISASYDAEIKDTHPTRAEAMQVFKVSQRKVDEATRVLHTDPEKFEKVHQGEMKLHVAYSQVTNKQKGDLVTEWPSGKYQVIYADPPWQYSNSGLGGSAESHYPTMSMDNLESMKDNVKSLAGDDAILFLWVTSPFLPEGLKLCHIWGFQYKTSFVWIKDRSTYGKLGFYNYSQHEFLFVASKGSCLPRSNSLVPSVIVAPKGEHSAKPELVCEIIEKMYAGPYIELFARKRRPNWECWGTL